MKNRMTQKELAGLIGVSQPVISGFLNNPGTGALSREKKDLLLKLIRERNIDLGSRVADSIGFVGSAGLDDARHSPDDFSYMFYKGIMHSAAGLNKRLVLYDSQNVENSLLEVKGIICHARLTMAQVKRLIVCQPVVLLNHEFEELVCDTVIVDDTGGTDLATSYLAEKGHEKIGFFGLVGAGRDYYNNIHFFRRLNGYREALRRHNIPANKDYIRIYESSGGGMAEAEDFAVRAIKSFEKQKDFPTAVVSPGDSYAMMFMKAAQGLGYRIPDDVSVTGFDNVSACDFASPGLTTVGYHMGEMCDESLRLLRGRIEGDGSMPKKVVCSISLVERGSVKNISRRNRRQKEVTGYVLQKGP